MYSSVCRLKLSGWKLSVIFLGAVYLLKGLLLYYYVMGLIKFLLELVLVQQLFLLNLMGSY